MSGYAASGRITRSRPRFVGSGAGADDDPLRRRANDLGAERGDPYDERPLDVRLAEWWAGVRDEWSQATFFLFDPNSWR